jgi:dTDP-4-dehydrorhamnose 3,5-epimerase
MVFDIKGRPHIAIVPPKIVHAYRNIGETDGLVINMPDRLYRGKDKTLPVDEIRYENDPASPYRLD